MPFQGWPEEALDFYDGLEADNSKAYWLAHKEIYETCVLAPMAELLAELEAEHGETKIYRPYRDVRFSKDKSPYKTAIGAHAGDGYIQLSAAGLAAGSGMYGMAPDQLERYRSAVAADSSGGTLEEIIAELGKQDIDVHGRDSLKSAPRGYPPDHPRIELLRYKGVVAWKEWPVEPWLGTPAARAAVADFLIASQPLGQWLTQHVGPSAEPVRARR
ncbi:MAG TPA: DUF2461 domain-containing protein [Streptosporangiaceae bacterium]|nr:DUF2461 domain-containing protein [Streptosporangiaceae bacterium]